MYPTSTQSAARDRHSSSYSMTLVFPLPILLLEEKQGLHMPNSTSYLVGKKSQAREVLYKNLGFCLFLGKSKLKKTVLTVLQGNS